MCRYTCHKKCSKNVSVAAQYSTCSDDDFPAISRIWVQVETDDLEHSCPGEPYEKQRTSTLIKSIRKAVTRFGVKSTPKKSI